MSFAERLADGRLAVAKSIASDDMIADGMDIIGPDDPEYAEWDAWLAQTEKAAHVPITRFNPNHVPAGSPDGGQFTSGDGGGGGGGDSAPHEPAHDPLAGYGGMIDDWERATVTRLNREAKVGIEAVGKTAERLQGEEPDVSASVKPGSWDDLSASQQQNTEQEYISSNLSHEMDSQIESWQEGLKDQVTEDNAFLEKAAGDWAKPGELDEDGNVIPVPDLDIQSLQDAVVWHNGKATVDPAELRWLRDNPNQGEMFTPEQIGQDLAARWAPWKEDFEIYMANAVKDEVERLGSEAPPDWVEDQAKESLSEYFSQLDDEEKFANAKNFGYTDEADSTVRQDFHIPSGEELDLLDHGGAIGASAKLLVQARYEEIAKARGLDTHLLSPDTVWGAWKNSSTSQGGLLLQLATAEELGSRMTSRVQGLAQQAGLTREAATGEERFEAAKAYVRALWETNQYLMDRAGVHSMNVYRAIDLPKASLDSTTNTKLGAPDYYVALPDLRVQQNSAQSATAHLNVANKWQGVDRPDMASPERVVFRVKAPPTSILSLPIYGDGVHEEREVVLAGLPWYAYDVWRMRAPSVSSAHPIKSARGRYA